MLKHRALMPVLSEKLFGLKPYIFDWVLLWSIQSKLYTSDGPFVTRFAHIYSFKIFPCLFTSVIRGTIPADNETLSFKLLAQKLDKYHGPTSIRTITGDNDEFSNQCINSSIIGLSLMLICDRKFDTSIAWSPYIATGILPNQMTFIDIQYNDRAITNGFLVCLHQITDLFFLLLHAHHRAEDGYSVLFYATYLHHQGAGNNSAVTERQHHMSPKHMPSAVQ
jgi:hypothetical protein